MAVAGLGDGEAAADELPAVPDELALVQPAVPMAAMARITRPATARRRVFTRVLQSEGLLLRTHSLRSLNRSSAQAPGERA